jgi:hypothetical protein
MINILLISPGSNPPASNRRLRTSSCWRQREAHSFNSQQPFAFRNEPVIAVRRANVPGECRLLAAILERRRCRRTFRQSRSSS